MLIDSLTASLADRYTILREIGEGGMATVFLAEDLKHKRQVAIKVLRPELTAELGAERFLREIETTANLRHPHIVPLYDSGEADGLLFYVMPLVEGESLRARLDREKQLPIDDALQIAREVADALSYAHGHGVIHRDIKPENVMLESGHAVVTDFGIAKALTIGHGQTITQTGMAIGTPNYMSPEQAAGEAEIDGRSDVYALGCVLYEMLGGQPPFTGPTTESVVRQHLGADPRPITQLRPSVPAAVAVALQRSLAKNPADRFTPVVQFAEALRVPESAAAAIPGRSHRGLMAAAGVVTVAVITAALLLRGGTTDAPLKLGSTTQITLEAGVEVDPAISPDGQFVSYAAGPITRMQIYVRRVSGGRPVVLSTDADKDHRWPRWSPDGSQIAYQTNDGILVRPAFGGSPRVVTRVEGAATMGMAFTPLAGLTWSPDGGELAYATSAGEGAGIRVVSVASSGDSRALPSPREVNSPAWSPDGRWIAVVAGNMPFTFGTAYFANVGASSLWLVDVAGGPPRRLTPGTALDLSPQWTPDGGALLFVSDRGGTRDIYRLRVDDAGAPLGEPERITTSLNVHSMTVARETGDLAYALLSSTSNIWSLPVPANGPVSASGAVAVTTGNQIIEALDVTADGTRLAFDSDREGRGDIYTMAVDGGEPVRLTTDSIGQYAPDWSPNEQRLAFHAIRAGNRDLYTINADGTDLQQHTTASTQELDVTWSPRGDALVAELMDSAIGGRSQMVIVDLANADAARVVDVDVDSDFIVWSPREERVAFHAADGIRTMPIDGGPSRLLASNAADSSEAFYAEWSRNGQTLYYLALGPDGWLIRSVPAGGGPSRVLVRFDDPTRQPTRYGFDVGGGRFFVTLGSHESDIYVAKLEEGN
jgi:Tol biopolymer transport system component/tRNA A-37 threonylcarbamoyl transferase component Bud32